MLVVLNGVSLPNSDKTPIAPQRLHESRNKKVIEHLLTSLNHISTTTHITSPFIALNSSIRITLHNILPQLSLLIQFHQIIPRLHNRNRNPKRLPHILPIPFVPIISSQRPDLLLGHTRIARHYRHYSILDHNTIQRGQLMSISLLLVVFTTVWVAPFVSVLSTERVECVCEAGDDAFGAFLGPGAGDCQDGDVVFVFEAAI